MNQSGILAGQTAIVTGAGRGLGRAVAEGLAHQGSNLVLAARNEDELAEVVRSVTPLGIGALAVRTDVTDADQVSRLVDAAMARFGKIDILVNNAGVIRESLIVETTDKIWDTVVSTNLQGAFHCTRAVGQEMSLAGRGKIVNVSSVFGSRAVRGFGVYGMTKAALMHLTKVTALELARHGVQVNGVAPGYFETDLNEKMREDPEMVDHVIRSIPARRMGKPPELAPLVVFLASSAADYITGQTIAIDGGLLTR